MEATYTFYSNGSLKLTFLNPIPAEERNSFFEIEEGDFVNLHPDLLINGQSYQGYIPEPGSYIIDYNDGQFGSVTFNITFVR